MVWWVSEYADLTCASLTCAKSQQDSYNVGNQAFPTSSFTCLTINKHNNLLQPYVSLKVYISGLYHSSLVLKPAISGVFLATRGQHKEVMLNAAYSHLQQFIYRRVCPIQAAL